MEENNNFKKFFNKFWYVIEPIVLDFLIYAVLNLILEGVSYSEGLFPNGKLKDISMIKSFTLIGAFSLLSVHALAILFIRLNHDITTEAKNVKKDNNEDNNGDDKNKGDDDTPNQPSKVKKPELNPKSAVDEIEETHSLKENEPEKVKIKDER